MCACACVCIRLYIYIYICVCYYVHNVVHMFAGACTHIRMSAYVCGYAHVRVRVSACVRDPRGWVGRLTSGCYLPGLV